MQFSNGAYHTPMEREFYSAPKEKPRLEKPIIPISELGVTVVEKDQMTGGHFIQNIDAALRQGVKKMQLVMTTGSNQAMGGRPKAYGKEYRKEMRDLIRANDVQIAGLEMPTSTMSNLSGYDPQQHAMSEHKRQQDIQEVKDAIKFIGDVAGGGGVDIWSQEYSRDIYDAKWNKKEGKWKDSFEAYKGEKTYSTAYVVDERTGRVSQIPKGQPIFEPKFKEAEKNYWGKDVDGKDVEIREGDWVTDDNKWIDPMKEDHLIRRMPKWDSEKREFEVKPLSWEELEKRANKYNKRFGKELTPEEFAIKTQLDNQIIQRKGQSLYYSQRYDDQIKQLGALQESLKYYEKMEADMPKEEMWKIMEKDPVFRGQYMFGGKMMKPSEIIGKEIKDIHHHLKHVHEASSAADAQAEELMEQKRNMTSLAKYARGRSVDAYAELGIAAMEETKHNRNVKKDIHVGPELGWPQAYGGHPEEFIELIQNSRKEMAKKLVKDRGFNEKDAIATAKKHIAGTWDTSHMGMWLNNFKKDPNNPRETEEQRVKRFKVWYMDMTKRLAETDVVGGIQIVDSASGAHGHLPAGQGFLGQTLIEAVDHLRASGFDGFMVSEGHEEEQFGKGRIMLQTWKAFGSDISSGFFDQPAQWGDVEGAYFGHANPPPYIVGGYAPSEEYRGSPFWSGLPLD